MKRNLNTGFPAGLLSLVAAFLVMMMTGACSSEPIDASLDANEQYNHAFIREFGVPAPNHTWSEAEKAALTVVATAATPIKVYYEDGGQLLLTGDLTARPGSHEIPFIIPSGVKTLKVVANGEEYDVPIGSTLDLDKAMPSRAFATEVNYVNYTMTPEYSDDVDAQRENCIKFIKDELAKVYFDEFPIGQNNIKVGWKDGLSYMQEIYVRSGSTNKTYYIYPIFWSNKNGEATADQFQLGVYSYPNFKSFEDLDRNNVVQGNEHYFSSLCFAAFEDGENHPFYEYGGFNASNMTDTGMKTMNQAYNLDAQYVTVESQGIKINGGSFFPAVKFGDYCVTTAKRNDNKNRCWGNRYWNLPLNLMGSSYSGQVAYIPKEYGKAKTVKFKVWRKQEDGTYAWEERTRPAFFIGFSAAPKLNIKNGFTLGDDTPCDFCDVVYFVAAEDADTEIGYTSSGASSSAGGSSFIVAAEDLGGSYDWDFNDAVFKVTCTTKDPTAIAKDALNYSGDNWPYENSYNGLKLPYVCEFTVEPLAAGGTMPIYVAYHGSASQFKGAIDLGEIDATTMLYNDFVQKIQDFNIDLNMTDGTWIVGTELHKWLGASGTNQAINVGDKVTNSGRCVKFYVDAKMDPMSETMVDGSYTSGLPSKDDQPLMRFSVIVDKNNTLGIDTSANFDPNGTETVIGGITKFDGTLGEGSYRIGAISQDKSLIAPQMITTRDAYSWMWPKEGHNIQLAYPKFAEWVADPTAFYTTNNTIWWENTKDPSHIVAK